MMQPQAENETSRWTAEGHPLSIEYSSLVMEGIRAAVVEGFYRIARGGIEVGGVLYGTRSRNSVRILAFRPLASEHASGPSFVLSEKDQEALRELLEAPAVEGELEGLIPVGWYHSHTRSDIFLSDQDRHIYDRFFSEPWQVALVLRPEKLKPVRAGFFFRERDGALQATSSYREFTVEPSVRKSVVPASSKTPVAEESPRSLAGPNHIIARRLWVGWILFTAALLGLLAGALLLAKPYLLPYLPKQWKMEQLFSGSQEPDRKMEVLSREVERLRGELQQVAARNQELKNEVEALQERLRALDGQGQKPGRPPRRK